MRKFVILILFSFGVSLVLWGYNFFSGEKPEDLIKSETGLFTKSQAEVMVGEDGFSPLMVTIQNGGTVTWKNESGKTIFVASDPHPTHTNLPEFQSDNVAPGESYSFTFDRTGTWSYHNHLLPRQKGIVAVGE